MRRRWLAVACAVLIFGSASASAEAQTRPAQTRRHVVRHHKSHKKLVHQAGWAGAGFTAGQVAGPVGGAAVGAAKYRKDIKAGGKRRTKAAVKIGAPIAATAIAGPVGTVGYGAYESRHFIKKHVLPHHHSHRTPRRAARRPAAHARTTLHSTR
jgi:hypothetical protein